MAPISIKWKVITQKSILSSLPFFNDSDVCIEIRGTNYVSWHIHIVYKEFSPNFFAQNRWKWMTCGHVFLWPVIIWHQKCISENEFTWALVEISVIPNVKLIGAQTQLASIAFALTNGYVFLVNTDRRRWWESHFKTNSTDKNIQHEPATMDVLAFCMVLIFFSADKFTRNRITFTVCNKRETDDSFDSQGWMIKMKYLFDA